MIDNGNRDVEDVLAADWIQELKTGGWKKQLNLMDDGSYEVSVYWVRWRFETERNDLWLQYFDDEKEAQRMYDSLKSMSLVKMLLPKVEDVGFYKIRNVLDEIRRKL